MLKIFTKAYVILFCSGISGINNVYLSTLIIKSMSQAMSVELSEN